MENPFSDKFRLLGDHADPLRSNPVARSFSRPFTLRTSNASTWSLEDSPPGRISNPGSSVSISLSESHHGDEQECPRSKRFGFGWFSKKRMLCIWLPILCLIALVVSLVVVHVREAAKVDSKEEAKTPGASTEASTTDRKRTSVIPLDSTRANGAVHVDYTTIDAIVSLQPAVMYEGTRPVTTFVTSTTVSANHAKMVAESMAVLHTTSTKEVITTKTQTDGATLVETHTSVVTTAVHTPKPEASTSHQKEVASQEPSSAAGKPAPIPQNPNGGAEDVSATTRTTSKASVSTNSLPSIPDKTMVGSSLSQNTESFTAQTRTLGTSPALVNPVQTGSTQAKNTRQISPATTTTQSPTQEPSSPKVTTTTISDSNDDSTHESVTGTTNKIPQATTTAEPTRSPISNFQSHSGGLLATP